MIPKKIKVEERDKFAEKDSAVIPNKRMVLAKCKLCGRIYWHFSDVEPWSEMERRLSSHLWFHVDRGDLTPAEAKNWHDWYDLVWFRVYNPNKVFMAPEQYKLLHPEIIPETEYEELKMLSRVYPPAFLKFARIVYEKKEAGQ